MGENPLGSKSAVGLVKKASSAGDKATVCKNRLTSDPPTVGGKKLN